MYCWKTNQVKSNEFCSYLFQVLAVALAIYLAILFRRRRETGFMRIREQAIDLLCFTMNSIVRFLRIPRWKEGGWRTSTKYLRTAISQSTKRLYPTSTVILLSNTWGLSIDHVMFFLAFLTPFGNTWWGSRLPTFLWIPLPPWSLAWLMDGPLVLVWLSMFTNPH